MREASITLEDLFKVGVRRLKTNPANAQAWIQAKNVRVGTGGLEAYEEIANPFTGVSGAWPLPQVFSSSIGLLAANASDVYTVDGGYAASSVLSCAAAGSYRWSLADFGRYMVLANGGAPVERSIVYDAVTDTESIVWAEASVGYTVDAVCAYNGQLIGAGFGSGYENMIAWSDIGDVDLSTFVSLSSTNVKNVAGNRLMEWDGSIYQVLKLGKAVVVYGSGGISILPEASEPVPTFGYKALNTVGIAGRYCVSGNEDMHLWVDKAGFVWMMKADYKPVLLGYQEYLLDMLGNTIVVSFNSHKGDWYISDGTTSYLCNETGMSSVYQAPKSVVSWGGGVIGITIDGTNQEVELVSDKLDMGNRDLKLISVIETDISSVAYAAVDYKFNVSDEWAASPYKQFNKHGFVTPIMSGHEFRLRLKWTDYEDFSASYAILRYKQVDRRSIRGRYVTPRETIA